MNKLLESKYTIPGLIVGSFLLLLAGMIWAVNAFSFKVATLDVTRIQKESTLGQELIKEITNKQTELKAKSDLAKTDAEKSKYVNEFQQFQAELNDKFTTEVKKAIKTVAKRRGISSVASPQVFVYSNIDLTDDIIKELAK